MMNTKKLLIIIALLLITINLILSQNLSKNFIKGLVGFAGSDGYVNITISATASVNFTQSTLNWGAGSLNDGVGNATIETSTPSVARGNWSTSGVSGLILENIGTTNVTLTLKTNKNASTLFGGDASNRAYKWNVTSNEAGSCNPSTLSNSSFREVNTSGYQFCNQLGFLDNQDTVRLDLLLTIPYNGNVGVLTDTITATITVA